LYRKRTRIERYQQCTKHCVKQKSYEAFYVKIHFQLELYMHVTSAIFVCRLQYQLFWAQEDILNHPNASWYCFDKILEKNSETFAGTADLIKKLCCSYWIFDKPYKRTKMPKCIFYEIFFLYVYRNIVLCIFVYTLQLQVIFWFILLLLFIFLTP
jgi:hypothetical protein